MPVEVSAKILPDGRWLAIDRDISERKRAEETLRRTQERFEFALNGANLGSWDWNITTGEVISNARCAEMRGFGPEELTPSADAYFASIHPDDLTAFQEALSACIAGGSEFECEYRARTKAGDWIWVLSQGNIFARNAQLRPTRMVGTALNITPRKRAEQALRLSEAAAKQATQVRDDVLGVVAHDLRNPLAAIRTLATVLQKTSSEREIGDEIAHAADRMSSPDSATRRCDPIGGRDVRDQAGACFHARCAFRGARFSSIARVLSVSHASARCRAGPS